MTIPAAACTRLDHIVIAAETLDAGRRYLLDRLGVDIPPGGRHRGMATHNCVMSLGAGVYFELIAIDPDAISQQRPRWFDLDNPWLRQALTAGPRLVTWVVRVDGLDTIPYDRAIWGQPRTMKRDDLRWRITIPDDGRLPGAGLLPTMIEWECEPPANAMKNPGCTLKSLTIRHPATAWVKTQLESIDAVELVDVVDSAPGSSGIEAVLDSPRGTVILR
ncbi:MAG: VOC family protein [Proteobacteria bacterium]|nr:MAG: VOC family protein [Pseudomonadota bacterium]